MKFYTVKEVAKILRVQPIAIYTWIKMGKLDCVKINKTIRFTDKQIEQLSKPKTILRKRS
jgi:excisionase family DNA binding protein